MKKYKLSLKEELFLKMIKDVHVSSMTLNELVELINLNGYFSKYYIREKLKKYALIYKPRVKEMSKEEKLFLSKFKGADFINMTVGEIYGVFKNEISKNYISYLLKKHQISCLKYSDIKAQLKKNRETNHIEKMYPELCNTMNEIYKLGLVPTWSKIAEFENVSKNKIRHKYKGIKLMGLK
jgi:hypothetical protein